MIYRGKILTGLFISDTEKLKKSAPFSSLNKRDAERLFSRALLNKALNLAFGLEELPEIIYDENGKPRFDSRSIHFSISHSERFAAAAVSSEACGVDIEIRKPRRRSFIEKIAEKELIKTDFYEFWCLKEAYFKLTGSGDLRSPSGIFVRRGKIFGPDGSSQGKSYDFMPDFALALFSSSGSLPEKPVFISADELSEYALRELDRDAQMC